MESNQVNITKNSDASLDLDDYEYAENKVSYSSCEELIEIHKSLIGKVDRDYDLDYYQYFMERIVNIESGTTILNKCSDEIIKFINSKYCSDYYKKLVSQKLSDFGVPEIVDKAVNSERNFDQFDENELDAIYNSMNSLKNIDNTYLEIIALTFNLKSQAAKMFLNDKVDPVTVIKKIVTTSGLAESPEYYSGRGALQCDLSGKNLFLIFNKLVKIDEKKAFSFAKMTLEMPTLGATEFLNSLYRLASNEYNLNTTKKSNENIDFGNAGGNEFVAVVIGTSMGQSYRHHDETNDIKKEFARLLPSEIIQPIIEEVKSKRFRGYEYTQNGFRKY